MKKTQKNDKSCGCTYGVMRGDAVKGMQVPDNIPYFSLQCDVYLVADEKIVQITRMACRRAGNVCWPNGKGD